MKKYLLLLAAALLTSGCAVDSVLLTAPVAPHYNVPVYRPVPVYPRVYRPLPYRGYHAPRYRYYRRF